MEVKTFRLKVKPDGKKAITFKIFATNIHSAKLILSVMECCPVDAIKEV